MPAKETPCCTAVMQFRTMPVNFLFTYNQQVWKKLTEQTAILNTGKNPEPRLFLPHTMVVPYHQCACRQ